MTDLLDTRVEETKEQKVARIRALRTRVALEEAPAAVEHLRELLLPGDGRTERGEVFSYARTPLLTRVADDADETYAVFVKWVLRWSKVLNVPAPSTAMVAYRIIGVDEVMGFKTGTTPEGARSLMSVLKTWLLIHADQINRRDDAQAYQDEIVAVVWRVRAGHGLIDAHPVTTDPLVGTDGELRRCPFGHQQVRGVFFGEPIEAAEARGEFDFELADYIPTAATPDTKKDPNARAGRQVLDAVAGIRVECGYCGWTAKPKVSDIAGWLS